MKFLGSPFPRKRSTKSPGKFGENRSKIRSKIWGGHFENFGDFSFCTLSDLMIVQINICFVFVGSLVFIKTP